MKTMTCAALAGLFAVMAAPAASFADPRHCPPGLAKQGRCFDGFRDSGRIYFSGRYYDRLEDAYAAGYRDGRNDGWRVGGYLPSRMDYVVIRDYERYRLPPPRRGHYYARVNNEILLIEAATQLIAQALTGY